MSRGSGSGRKNAIEWNYVDVIENSTKVKCKVCECAISNKIERIRSHMANCKKKK